MLKFLFIFGLGAALTLPARAVEFDLYTNSITMPNNRTFEMPLTASDPGGGPLKFAVVSVTPKVLAWAISPVTNRSMVISVSGVDSNNDPFTGDITMQLFENLIPKTTSRIIDLVNSNFYDGLTFHRVVQDFVCQGGDPNGDGTGGSGVIIRDEYVATLQFTGFGQLALANSGHNTSDSQFFITDVDLSAGDTNKPSPQFLDFKYNLFGQVTRGFDIVSDIMGTAVNPTNSRPLTPVVMNSVTITNDPEATVLRLEAGAFTGAVHVVVSVMNASHEKVEQTITVTVVSNQTTDLPFFAPFPPSLTFTQGQSAFFPIRATDIDRNPLNLDRFYGNVFVPTNLNISIDVAGNLWMVPNNTSTGTVQMVLGVYDFAQNISDEDTEETTITIEPISATPTLNILPKSGTITDNAATNASSIKISGTFTAITPPIHTFTNIDFVILTLGDTNNPLIITNLPTATDRVAKKGVLRIKSPKGSVPTINAQFNTKGTFKIGVSNFNFPAAQTNQMQVGLQIGPDYGTNVQVWTVKKPGVFALPRP